MIRIRIVLLGTGLIGGLLLVSAAGHVRAAPPGTDAAEIGLLVAQTPGRALSAEADTAREVAERLLGADLLFPAGEGRFVDRAGGSRSLDGLRVLWCHQDDTNTRTGPLYDKETVAALAEFVESGGGLLLSGGAAMLAGPLGLDQLLTKPVVFGQDRAQSGLAPLAATHPAFAGIDLDRGVIWISNAAFPAYGSLQVEGSPDARRALARTPGGAPNPLLEYAAGQGRVIVLAWRLGRQYDDAAAAYRDNFEQLLTNLAGYLGDASCWQPLDVTPPSETVAVVSDAEWQALERAIRDLGRTFGTRYSREAEFLHQLATLRKSHDTLAATGRDDAPDQAALSEVAARFRNLRKNALLANPLLDFSRLLVIKRGAGQLGLPKNYLSNSSLPPTGYDNQLAVLSPVRPDERLETLYQPDGDRFVGDVDLHFDAQRLLFSSLNIEGRWRVFEMGTDGTGLRELPLINEPDVDNYDACYLPDERIAFLSTACFTGVPCVNGTGHVCNMYLYAPDGRIRQLTVEQDHDWCPTVLNNGRVMYLRWEYTDLPHAFSRILFHMNPDGTEQMEYYGSGSYWPASMFFARPIPNHPTKIVAVVGGHHELPRMGDLVIFDPARGRFEADGVVQRIPGYGRDVSPALLDLPIAQRWPKFLHPYPLSEKYFLVSCQPSASSPWGIYLADVFDNLVLLYEESGYAMLEPIPLRATPRPPVIPDKVDLSRHEAEVFVSDVYRGQGLRGVPRGTIKSLRVISYEFAYQEMGAEPYSVGLDGPWDPKLVLGTVPVHEDGSARFRIPAYTPIALQPLDAEGKAVQLMRSWMTAMPGEVVSCAGCHEKQNSAPPVTLSIASAHPPAEIQPWHGPVRGFDFRREVQPVLDRYCVGCHDGQPKPDGVTLCDFTDGPPTPILDNTSSINASSRFSPSYYQLRRFVRTPTKESDMYVPPPWEFHADTTRLVQILQKGHHDVRLDAEAWDRLITWIDLNAPFHGSWADIRGSEIGDHVRRQCERRNRMRERYTGITDEAAVAKPAPPGTPIVPPPRPPSGRVDVACPDWPFTNDEAVRRQHGSGLKPADFSVELAEGLRMDLVPIPAGDFVMGQEDGCDDECPSARVTIERPFWIGRCEVTNAQFAAFDPHHDSHMEHGDFIHFSPGERGWPLSRPTQPVVRVSWNQALAFCRWLSETTGRRFLLPTEAQWEYACRAGAATPLSYGEVSSDFSAWANLSDARHAAIDPFGWVGRVQTLPPWRPAETRYDDGQRVSAPVGSYQPNAWGLCDMHGNVAEWTRSAYRPYPYRDGDGRNNLAPSGKKVVRGGSWYDRPGRSRSAFRQAYLADQPVYDVGFRVVCEGDPERGHERELAHAKARRAQR